MNLEPSIDSAHDKPSSEILRSRAATSAAVHRCKSAWNRATPSVICGDHGKSNAQRMVRTAVLLATSLIKIRSV